MCVCASLCVCGTLLRSPPPEGVLILFYFICFFFCLDDSRHFWGLVVLVAVVAGWHLCWVQAKLLHLQRCFELQKRERREREREMSSAQKEMR